LLLRRLRALTPLTFSLFLLFLRTVFWLGAQVTSGAKALIRTDIVFRRSPPRNKRKEPPAVANATARRPLAAAGTAAVPRQETAAAFSSRSDKKY
jgi:hypothetical protein